MSLTKIIGLGFTSNIYKSIPMQTTVYIAIHSLFLRLGIDLSACMHACMDVRLHDQHALTHRSLGKRCKLDGQSAAKNGINTAVGSPRDEDEETVYRFAPACSEGEKHK